MRLGDVFHQVTRHDESRAHLGDGLFAAGNVEMAVEAWKHALTFDLREGQRKALATRPLAIQFRALTEETLAGMPEQVSIDTPPVKTHRCAGGGKSGASAQAIDRTKGGRNTIERMFGRLKDYRRIAMRYD